MYTVQSHEASTRLVEDDLDFQGLLEILAAAALAAKASPSEQYEAFVDTGDRTWQLHTILLLTT